jgi:hypothetical protein
MINFFRKIRRKIADDNKPLKYMRYAIGEIVLVVIGILIALSINNWNEKKKTIRLEKQYLERLELDLVQDTLYFNRRLKESQEVVEKNYELVHLMYDEQKNGEEVSDLLKHVRWNSENFVVQNSTYLELTNSSLINILSNQELKKSIISLYYEYNVVGTHIKEINEFSVSLYSEIVHDHAKYRPASIDKIWGQERMYNKIEWQYLNEPFTEKFKKLESTAGYYNVKHTVFTSYFNDLKAQATSLIKEIASELKK